MKALILAAGFGTRLLPYTRTRPKPLFTLAGNPILGITIEKLMGMGCTEIIVNTHHLHGQIEAFIGNAGFGAPVQTRYEPCILDTGGAIKNVRDFMGASDFMVINADIVTDIDLESVWQFHCNGNWPATLVLHDRREFNKIAVDNQGFISGFMAGNDPEKPVNGSPLLAFTGIQVLSPAFFDHMPEKEVFSSIEVFENLAHKSGRVRAYVANAPYWEDMGTPAAYQRTALGFLALAAFESSDQDPKSVRIEPLAGDGSDRKWFRAKKGDRSLVISDHGICTDDPVCEIDSFISLGNHLHSKGIPVPRIIRHDRFSGMVALEDLGDTHLAAVIRSLTSKSRVKEWYCRVVDRLIDFSLKGIEGFDPAWAFQTPTYSRELILEKECAYFTEAFLKGYLNQSPPTELLLPAPEFEYIADQALTGACRGLMHRDFQSRNIMVKDGEIFFIDFQSARQGPLQYDLASLLIDPYVNLDMEIREEVLNHCVSALARRIDLDTEEFVRCFRHCCITRNLQILGAFSYLSMVKGKHHFKEYIPAALSTLKACIVYLEKEKIPTLNRVIAAL
ncbi:MAG: phosphotransferase [Desulfobacteraceae bacterium]|nr:phosphotransferase [Desulfobacteraceae bacterium]